MKKYFKFMRTLFYNNSTKSFSPMSLVINSNFPITDNITRIRGHIPDLYNILFNTLQSNSIMLLVNYGRNVQRHQGAILVNEIIRILNSNGQPSNLSYLADLEDILDLMRGVLVINGINWEFYDSSIITGSRTSTQVNPPRNARHVYSYHRPGSPFTRAYIDQNNQITYI